MRKKWLNKKCMLGNKFVCSKCGKMYFAYNMNENAEICRLMVQNNMCWECAYWERFLMARPKYLEVIGDRCYQIFPYVYERDAHQILGGGGKIRYFLKRDGSCQKVNDIWWLNTIPWQYQKYFQPTGWWVSKMFYERARKVRKPCTARGCMDRYRCYRYKYQIEFENGPYNIVPSDWRAGDEHCPAFLPLSEIKDFDEYVKPSDIIDKNSVAQK